MNYADLINTITTRIATNGQQAITAQVLQDVLVEMVQEMGQSGALVGGVVDTSYVPDPSNDAQLIYIAQGIGTYPNFGGLTVVDGEVAFFYYDGNAWQKSSVSVNVAVEVIDNLTSTATDKALSANQGRVLDEKKADKVVGAVAGNMAGLDANGNLVDSGVAASAVGDVSDKIDKVHDAEVGNVPMFKADGGIEDGGVAADNIAEQDGYYETMVVGAAENLIGRGSVPANYTRRRSGGGSIGSGAAVLEEIRGNTLVFNQMQPTISSDNYVFGSGGVTVGTITDGVIHVEEDSTGSDWGVMTNPSTCYFINGHKYYASILFVKNFAGQLFFTPLGNSDGRISITTGIDTSWKRYSSLATYTGTTGYQQPRAGAANANFDAKDWFCIDLTQMYGAGNEPATTAEFEAMFPLNYYAYGAGTAKHFTGTGLQTNGFNQWDEEWENGKYDLTTGEPIPEATQVRSKNYIPVFGNETYYFTRGGTGNIVSLYYDADFNYISYLAGAPSARTMPANARYVRFYMTGPYGNTYNHDICINFSDSARNGEYEPYWSETKALPITTATSGGVAIFPEGEKSAGTAHDRYYKSAGSDLFDKAEVVIGALNLGTLTGWTYNSANQYFSKSNANIKLPADWATVANIKCATYYPVTGNAIANGVAANMSIAYAPNGTILIKNTAYTTSVQLEAALAGVTLYFESRTVTDYTLDTPFSAQYRVDGMGTETLLPQNTATPTTSPIICDVKYPMNAVDTLRNLPQNYISKASMDAILTAFKTAGVITGYTLTWDATNQKYNCTITP